jgi:hypothetical protein
MSPRFPGPGWKPGDQTALMMDQDLVGMFALAHCVQRVVVVPEALLPALEELSRRPQIADRVRSHSAPPGRPLDRPVKALPQVWR